MIATSISPGDSLSHMAAVPQPVEEVGTKRVTVQNTAAPASNMQQGQHQQWPPSNDILQVVGQAAAQGVRFAVGELTKPGPGGNPSGRSAAASLWLSILSTGLSLFAIFAWLGHQYVGNQGIEDDQVKLAKAVEKIDEQNKENQALLNKRIAAIEVSQLEQGKAVSAMGDSISAMSSMTSWLVRAEDARSRGEKPPRAPLPFGMPN